MMLLRSDTTILFAFAAILLSGCQDSDELISARSDRDRADKAIALFRQDIADLEIQVEKVTKQNKKLREINRDLAQTNKKLRQENIKLTKQIEDLKKEAMANKPKKAVVPKVVLPKLFSKPKPKKYTVDKIGAWVMAQSFVEVHLKLPRTAKYGWQVASECVQYQGNGLYSVAGWVESENALGGKVRSYFSLGLKDLGEDKWMCIEGPVFRER